MDEVSDLHGYGNAAYTGCDGQLAFSKLSFRGIFITAKVAMRKASQI